MRSPIIWGSLLTLIACGTQEGDGTVSNGWTILPNDHARNFSIAVREEQRMLYVFGPGGRTDTLGVYHIGATHMEGALSFPHASPRIAVASTTHLAYIGALRRGDAVVGAAHLHRMPDASPWTKRTSPVVEIGTATGLDRELLVSLSPHALLDYPFGKDAATVDAHGVPVIAITEYLEEHPLGRAEWLRFFGVLLDAERVADSLYNEIAGRYRALAATKQDDGPLVFFGSSWKDRWYAPGAHSYMAALIRDAGGRYVLEDRAQEGNITLDREMVSHLALHAAHFGQVLAYEGSIDALAVAGGDPRLAAIPAVVHGGFHANSITSDLFGQALLEPDTILMDLHCILRPASCGGHNAKYFHALAQ